MTASLLLFVLSSSALGWEPRREPVIEAPAPVLAVRAVRIDDLDLLIVGMAEQTDFYDLEGTLYARVRAGMVDYTLVDVDRDQSKEIVLCGPRGVVVVEAQDFTSRVEFDHPCDAIEPVVDRREGPVVAVAAGQIILLEPHPNGLVSLGVVGNTIGAGRIAAVGDDWVFADTATSTIHLRSPDGDQVMDVGAMIGDVFVGPYGLGWSLPSTGILEDQRGIRWLEEGTPTRVVSAELDKDSQQDLVATHPSLGQISVTSGTGGGVAFYDVDGTPTSLFARDFDIDGCDDLVVGLSDPPGVQVIYTESCTRQPVETPRPAAQDGRPQPRSRKPSPRLFGIPVPTFQGAASRLPRQRLRLQRHVLFGAGFVGGQTLRQPQFSINAFPALSIELELGSSTVRWFIGGDSAPLFSWVSTRGRGIHLLNLSTGVTVGSPQLRTGPFVTGGLWSMGAGLRTVWAPWSDRWDATGGIELRLTALRRSTGQIMLMYVWNQPPERSAKTRARLGRPDPTIPGWQPVIADGERLEYATVDERSPVARAGKAGTQHPRCHRFSLGLGGAVGASLAMNPTTEEQDLRWSGSPVVSASCEWSGRSVALFTGVEMAPLFTSARPRGRPVRHLASHTLGVMLGGDALRIGPIGTVGIWTLSAGGRASVQLGTTRRGVEHRLEMRGSALAVGTAGQGIFLYTMGLDPGH
ncbi:MAG: hypothetical protein ACJATT_004580 [Myxococcota bacterium]